MAIRQDNLLIQQYLEAFERHRRATSSVSPGPPETDNRSIGGWFLGPKGENEDLLKELIIEALDEHVRYRREFHPEDPLYITPEMKASEQWRQAVAHLKRESAALFTQLKESVPFFSMRYQGHMNWDVTMPGLIGYFAAMLYNQNNVAVESSPVTTKLEMDVGNDLCRMLGYKVPDEGDDISLAPWGHITADGSIANLEALWAARNLKYFPVALRAAIAHEPELAPARELQVRLLNGELARLLDLDTWTLLNLRSDDILALTQRMAEAPFHIPLEVTTAALKGYSLQNLGFTEFYRRLVPDVPAPPVAFAPVTMHYSWPKSAALLGMGANHMIGVRVDIDGRIDLAHLEALLVDCLKERRPVVSVVAVIGSTEESAVDDLEAILEMRARFRKRGLEYTVHADAAWGGYFASMIREDHEVIGGRAPTGRMKFVPTMPLSPYVQRQYAVLGETDSITVDPHKAGYIPYPAGGLCYRNSAMRNLVSFEAPIVFQNKADPTVGIYGVEGSKAGAAAAATYLSHRVIPLSKSGYGRILGECVFTAKKLYARLVTMTDPRFQLTPFHRLPAEKEGRSPEEVAAQIEFIRRRIVGRSNEELVEDDEAMALFRRLGSDQVIIPYAFNFKRSDGRLNTDPRLADALNREVYTILSVRPGDDVNEKTLIVTSSRFDPRIYGDTFMAHFCRRLGVEYRREQPITFLLSTVMDPWTTDTPAGSFLPVIEQAIRDAVHLALDRLEVSDVAG